MGNWMLYLTAWTTRASNAGLSRGWQLPSPVALDCAATEQFRKSLNSAIFINASEA